METLSIASEVKNAFVHNPHLNHHSVHITANQGKVRLEGEVGTFFEKQMAQEAIRNISGIEQIDNELIVSPVS